MSPEQRGPDDDRLDALFAAYRSGYGSGMVMERGNTKHGPRLDEQMESEVRGVVQGGSDPRAEEWHQAEPAGEDQPNTTVAPAGAERTGAPPGMSPAEVARRSNLGRFVPMDALPGDRERVIAGAERMNAPDSVLDELRRLPADRSFETVSQIWAALGHHNEARRT